MPNIITVSYINQIQFLQMPKAFLYNPKYASMSNESKIIYTLLRDLVSLSIENNWINEDNEVYVKFSRAKLAEKVNVSPTNKKKMSALMKELKDLDLIVEKSVGLNKCNEIYVCIPEDLAIAYNPKDLLGESELLEKNSTVTLCHQGGGKNGTSGGSKNGTSGGSKNGTHINTNSNNTNLINKSSSSNDEDEDLKEVINLYRECINKKLSANTKSALKELIATYGKDHVLSAINVTMNKATSPNLAYLKKVCSSDTVSVSAACATKSTKSNSKFTTTYSHNWDFDQIAKNEQEYIEKMYG